MRPQIAAFQDLYSNKMLAYRVDLDPNKVAVMQAWGELVETYGIPRHCLFDNGMEFANKWLTGGTPTRFRFKVRPDDGLGVLPQMGVQIHWATPAHGQAKPIERGFRDFADRVAKHPAFAGAYVGNNPLAKPENYASRAIPLADFLAVLDQEVAKHNARPGRLTANAKGRSFDETFAESYAAAPIRKATPEQHRLWLMGQEKRKLHRTHGVLTLFKNGYTAMQFAETFENRSGLGSKHTIRKRLSVLATKGFVKFLRDPSGFGFPVTRSRFGYLCVEGMQFGLPVGEVDPTTGEVTATARPVPPSHFKCPQSGLSLQVENPAVWVYQDGSEDDLTHMSET